MHTYFKPNFDVASKCVGILLLTQGQKFSNFVDVFFLSNPHLFRPTSLNIPKIYNLKSMLAKDQINLGQAIGVSREAREADFEVRTIGGPVSYLSSLLLDFHVMLKNQGIIFLAYYIDHRTEKLGAQDK